MKSTSGWMFPHCCLLSDEHWGFLGCDIPRVTGGGVARLEAATPWFHVSVAIAPSGRFSRLVGYELGMNRAQVNALPIKHTWYSWKWKKRR